MLPTIKVIKPITEYIAKKFYKINDSRICEVNKKPQFEASDTKFSISHSKDIISVCFDDANVGFDIEFINQKRLSKTSNSFLAKKHVTLRVHFNPYRNYNKHGQQ